MTKYRKPTGWVSWPYTVKRGVSLSWSWVSQWPGDLCTPTGAGCHPLSSGSHGSGAGHPHQCLPKAVTPGFRTTIWTSQRTGMRPGSGISQTFVFPRRLHQNASCCFPASSHSSLCSHSGVYCLVSPDGLFAFFVFEQSVFRVIQSFNNPRNFQRSRSLR